MGSDVDTLAPPLPCCCGYDLRGLPPDGRCPECGRAIDDPAARRRAVVVRWRRWVRGGGGLVAAGWLLWARTIATAVWTGDLLPGAVPAGINGPSLNMLEKLRRGGGTRPVSYILAGSATVLVMAGLAVMSHVLRGARTWPRLATGWLVRLVAAWVTVQAAWFVASPYVRPEQLGLLARFVEGPFGLDDQLISAAGYFDAAVWAAVGLLLGVTLAAAGRPQSGVRAGTVSAAAAALAFADWRVGIGNGSDFRLAIACSVADAAVAAGVLLLVVRLGWTSFWSPLGRPPPAPARCGPAADGV